MRWIFETVIISSTYFLLQKTTLYQKGTFLRQEGMGQTRKSIARGNCYRRCVQLGSVIEITRRRYTFYPDSSTPVLRLHDAEVDRSAIIGAEEYMRQGRIRTCI